MPHPLRPARLLQSMFRVAVALWLLLTCIAQIPAAAGAAPETCSKLASPQGSEGGNGSPGAPFRTAQELVDALAPGEVGCLRAGTYGGGLTFGHGGITGAPIVLRSHPGEQALITGRVWVERGANNVTVADLALDGNYQDPSERLPSPTINANNVTFEHDDVTNDHTEICFDVGSGTWGQADGTVIAYDHIHDCGVMPAANHDHGIYMQDATNFQIVSNQIDHNADRGIQLYPNGSGGLIADNVISENGEGLIFSGEEGVAASDNVVEHNLIVKSLVRADIESWYPQGNPVGVGNVARDNCVSQRGIMEGAGFSSQENVVASPAELVATSAGGYTAVPGSTCAAALAGSPTSVTGATAAKHKPHPRKARPRTERRHRRHGHLARGLLRRSGRAHARSHRRARASQSQARDLRR